MKKIILIMATLIFGLIPSISSAELNTDTNQILNNIKYSENSLLGEKWSINLDGLSKSLSEQYNSNIFFEWNTRGDATITGTSYEKSFESFGDKNVILSIYKKSGNEKELIVDKKFNIYVYKKSLAFISEANIKNQVDEYKMKAKENGVIIYEIGSLDIKEIEKYNFIEKLEEYKNSFGNTSNYIVLWGSRDFLFDVIGKLNTKIENQNLNLVLISSFNMNILKNYLQNFISNKKWISNILLLNEGAKYEISKNAEDIKELENKIIENKYEYVNLEDHRGINSFLFISKFVNDLSNKGFNTTNIYIILIIPFLLIGVSFFKHFIGLSPTGLLIPTIITILLLKIGLIITLSILVLFLAVNLVLAQVINSYKLHYTPKVTLLIITNIVVFIIAINFANARQLLNININDVMFIIFFILISERLVNVIISKEFSEYKRNLLNTVIFSIISYGVFSIPIIKTFILAYPELILILLPISFIMGRFTGLRVSEYFRFKEVIRSIEE